MSDLMGAPIAQYTVGTCQMHNETARITNFLYYVCLDAVPRVRQASGRCRAICTYQSPAGSRSAVVIRSSNSRPNAPFAEHKIKGSPLDSCWETQTLTIIFQHVIHLAATQKYHCAKRQARISCRVCLPANRCRYLAALTSLRVVTWRPGCRRWPRTMAWQALPTSLSSSGLREKLSRFWEPTLRKS